MWVVCGVFLIFQLKFIQKMLHISHYLLNCLIKINTCVRPITYSSMCLTEVVSTWQPVCIGLDLQCMQRYVRSYNTLYNSVIVYWRVLMESRSRRSKTAAWISVGKTINW